MPSSYPFFTAAVASVVSLCATPAVAQSLVGVEVGYEATGSNLTPVAGSFIVDADNAELVLEGLGGVQYTVDIDATSVTITADFRGSVLPFIAWGSFSGENNGSLLLTGLRFNTAVRIGGVDVSQSTAQLDGADVDVTPTSIRIGDPAAPIFNGITWTDGSVAKIDLVTAEPTDPFVFNPRLRQFFGTIGEALGQAVSNDTLDLGPFTFNEDNLEPQIPNLTLRGRGPDRTRIDGVTPVFVFEGSSSRTIIENLTIGGPPDPNGRNSAILMLAQNTDLEVIVRDCDFLNNGSPMTAAGAIGQLGGTLRLHRCRFDGNQAAGDLPSALLTESQPTVEIIDCVFSGHAGGGMQIEVKDLIGNAYFTMANCTFAPVSARGHLVFTTGTNNVTLVNSVFAPGSIPPGIFGANAVFSGNVFPGAPGDNIDATPIFSDPSNGDYSLAPNSPGIDAADFESYLSAGGQPVDIANNERLVDDPATANTGVGRRTFLDAGAFELQPPAPNRADFNMDTFVDVFDVTDLLQAIADFLSS